MAGAGDRAPSTNIRNLNPNLESLDAIINSDALTITARETPENPTGKVIRTIAGAQADIDNLIANGESAIELAIDNAGYDFLDPLTFGSGATITDSNQALRWAVADGGNDEYYRWSGVLPKTVPAGSTPDTTGGVASGAWRALGSAAIASQLADPNKGAAMVAYRDTNVSEALDSKVTQISTVAGLRNTEPTHIGQLVYVLEYEDGTGYGGGLYRAVDSSYDGADSEETLGGARWRMVTEGNVFPIDRLGAVKDDPVSVKDAFIRAIECVREAGSGTVYVGPGEWTMANVLYEVNTSNITFHFDLGCHFKMEYVLLGWYPTAPGKGYSNVAIVGRGTIEALPDTMWHNDLVYVDGVELRDLTFIRPVLTGHFLDLMGSTNITVDGITVRGSNVGSRLFSEFIQVGGDNVDGLGWTAKAAEYGPLMGQGIGTTNTTLTNSVFVPYTDEDNVTTYPPRPIGNHGLTPGVRNLRIVGNTFKDVIRQDISARFSWLEIPNVDGVHISGNSFVCTNAASPSSVYIISLRGDVSSGVVDILDNTFDITRPDGLYTVCIQDNTSSGANISVTGNVFKCSAKFSDIIVLDKPGNIRVLGNSVVSTGRRFIYGAVAGSSCLVQGNDMVFPPTTEEDYRHPVEVQGSSLTIVGNRIEHPSMAFRAHVGSLCTAAGNTMVGGATAVTISSGVLTGNVFNTTSAPTVTIGGVAQTSQGWNFVHIPV